MSELSAYRQRTNQLLAQYSHACNQVGEERERLEAARAYIASVRQAQQLLQTAAHHLQEQAHQQITSVVTRCLEAVFDDPYQFAIKFEKKRGKTEARLVFYRGGHELDPLTAAGGGVTDVAAFALRLSCLMLSRPRPRRFVCLDEPFKGLKPPEYYGPRIRGLLESLTKEMRVQFLIVQNVQDYRTGKIIEL